MSKVLNADELLEALERPVLVLGGVTYEAKHLTFRKALSFQARLQELDTNNSEALVKFTEDLCEDIGVPSDKVLDLPPAVFSQVIEGFFGYLLGTRTE